MSTICFLTKHEQSYMKFFKVILILSCILVPRAEAQISVNDVIVQFKAGERPVQNIVVKNSSPDVFYVTATCEELTEPSEDKSPLVATEDILISPKKFSIDGNSERVIRMLHRKPADDKERVYRVAFVPQEKEFGEAIVRQDRDRRTMLRVITGMGILVFVDPAKPLSDLKWTRDGDTIKFYNAGNQHVRLSDGKACDSEGVGCTDIPTRRVYGGKEYVVSAPKTKTLYFTRRDGPSGDFKSIVIAP